MLRTRVLTALVLLPLALGALFYLPAQAFAIGLGVLLLIGTWEFHRLAGLKALPGGGVLLNLQAGIMVLLLALWNRWTPNPIIPFELACAVWLVLLLQLRFVSTDTPVNAAYRWRVSIWAILIISFGWMTLAWLRTEPAGQWWILLMLLIIWAADVGAYFSGRAFGKRKLAPSISPGKTLAGFYGGMIFAAVIAVLGGMFIEPLPNNPLALAVLGLVTALVSAGGDLFISLHKRIVGIKDSGRLFPGHGGVLDRLDSLLAGAPFFVLGKLLLGL